MTVRPGLQIGQRVKVGRDEKEYPSRGTWPQFRGRVGTVVALSPDEIGVAWNAWEQQPGRSQTDAWFMPYELTLISELQYLAGIEEVRTARTDRSAARRRLEATKA